MTDFKIGDKVRFTDTFHSDWVGQEGVVESVSGDSVAYTVTKAAPTDLDEYWNTVGDTRTNHADQFELLEPAEKAAHPSNGKAEDVVNDPSHYGGADNPYEVIKVAEAWGFNDNAYLFNALKYLGRCEHKGSKVKDLKKLVYYVNREIALEAAK